MTEETQALVAAPATELAPLTIDSLVQQVELIQQATTRAMREGEHYGVIPGTKKPTLLQPGAQKLSLLFRLRPRYTITQRDLENDHREYEVLCDLSSKSGEHEGQGVGMCSTMESKYRWRTAKRACPHCGAAAVIKGKAEYGGGWLCFKKQDGCGAKFADGDPSIESQPAGRTENPDIADTYNTVLKIGKKRAFVDAILTATAAGDIWTQDIEDATFGAPQERQPRQEVMQAPMSPEQADKYHAKIRTLESAAGADRWATTLRECQYTDDQLMAITDHELALKAYRKLQQHIDALPEIQVDADMAEEEVPEMTEMEMEMARCSDMIAAMPEEEQADRMKALNGCKKVSDVSSLIATLKS